MLLWVEKKRAASSGDFSIHFSTLPRQPLFTFDMVQAENMKIIESTSYARADAVYGGECGNCAASFGLCFRYYEPYQNIRDSKESVVRRENRMFAH